MKLITSPNVARPDEVYQWLVDLHRGLSEDASSVVNAKLILLLINHIGDEQVVREAIAAARESRQEAQPTN